MVAAFNFDILNDFIIAHKVSDNLDTEIKQVTDKQFAKWIQHAYSEGFMYYRNIAFHEIHYMCRCVKYERKDLKIINFRVGHQSFNLDKRVPKEKLLYYLRNVFLLGIVDSLGYKNNESKNRR